MDISSSICNLWLSTPEPLVLCTRFVLIRYRRCSSSVAASSGVFGAALAAVLPEGARYVASREVHTMVPSCRGGQVVGTLFEEPHVCYNVLVVFSCLERIADARKRLALGGQQDSGT